MIVYLTSDTRAFTIRGLQVQEYNMLNTCMYTVQEYRNTGIQHAKYMHVHCTLYRNTGIQEYNMLNTCMYRNTGIQHAKYMHVHCTGIQEYRNTTC